MKQTESKQTICFIFCYRPKNIRKSPKTNEKCKQCYTCVSSCDHQAIKLSDDKEISINEKICKKCYKCIEACSEKALYTDWDKVIFWVRFAHRLSKNTETIFLA